MKKLNKLIALVIVLLLSYSKSWCQTNDSIPYGENDTIQYVTIPISYIRAANVKLTEHKYCPKIIAQKDSIINNYKEIVSDYDKLFVQNEKLKKKNKLYKKTTIGATLIAVVLAILL